MDDRISLLPDSILHEILSFLDSKSVVQTCVLSKRWKTLWTDIPTLNFHFQSKAFSPKHFICRFLSKHCSRFIKKLSFSSSVHTDETLLIVDLLLCYARHNTVQQLHLNTFDTLYAEWPLGFSDSSSLTVLQMKRLFYDTESDYPPSLKFLKVEFVDFVLMDPFSGGAMFTHCPNLESLVLVNYFYPSFHISAPKLENLELFSSSSGWELTFPEVELLAHNLKSVQFTNILPTLDSASEFPCIDKVNITIDDSDFGGEDDSAIQRLKVSISQLLKVFHNAKSFTLPLKAMEMILSDSSSLRQVSFPNLRYLKLKTEETDQMTNLSIGTLMNSLNCPNLEKLEVDLNQATRKASTSLFQICA